jgi:RNA recognition motif-containing protein
MIRGIPCSCTKDEILDAIGELGFERRHDYFYVPLRKKKTLGYAFVGFPDPQVAQEFVEAITGFSFKNRQSSKVVTVTPATVQGARNKLDDLKNHRSMKHKGQPIASSRFKNRHISKVVTAMPAGTKDARNNSGHFKNTYLMSNSM